MAANRRTRGQREQDLITIADAYLRGEPLARIGERLGVTRQQVHYDLTELRTRWQATVNRDMSEAVAHELAKLDHLETEYWEAWTRSREPRETTTTESSEAVSGERKLERLQRAGRDGNPQFLDGVAKCIDRRIKLMGLDAPTRLDIQGPLRAWAASEGLDPDEVVKMANGVIREHAGRAVE